MNVKHILASLSCFLWWNPFWDSFEACFNFNLIKVCISLCNYGVRKGITIAHHHMPTWWVACDLSHVYSLWNSWRGVRLLHNLAFLIPKPPWQPEKSKFWKNEKKVYQKKFNTSVPKIKIICYTASYASWDSTRDRCNIYFSFWVMFWSFTP